MDEAEQSTRNEMEIGRKFDEIEKTVDYSRIKDPELSILIGNRRHAFYEGYHVGQTAERERLLKLAPEFDHELAWVGRRSHIGLHGDVQFIKGARWQHAQLAHVIGALREEVVRLTALNADLNLSTEAEGK